MTPSRIKNPCTPDCKDRKEGCKVFCEKEEYRAYRREIEARRKSANDRERMLDSYFNANKRRR
jgi:hypothetical protein